MTTNSPESSSFQGVALSAALTVRDLETSVGWYRDVVGFSVAQNFEREGKLMAVSLRAGDDVRILITQDDGAKGLDRPKGDGFSLQITTNQDIDAIAERIRSAGSTLDTEPVDTPWGRRIFRVRDPDGFRLTISTV